VTQIFSCVNIFAPIAQKTAQKKRNFGVFGVFTRLFLRSSAKNGVNQRNFYRGDI
jgi:hypothetical protein